MTDPIPTLPSTPPSDEPFDPFAEDDDDAVQEPSPASEALRDQAGAGGQVRGGDTEGDGPARAGEAQEVLAYTASYCRRCPVSSRCPEEVCAIWRQEKAALADLEREAAAIPVVAGIPLHEHIL